MLGIQPSSVCHATVTGNTNYGARGHLTSALHSLHSAVPMQKFTILVNYAQWQSMPINADQCQSKPINTDKNPGIDLLRDRSLITNPNTWKIWVPPTTSDSE